MLKHGEDLTEFYDVTLYDNGAQLGQQKVMDLEPLKLKQLLSCANSPVAARIFCKLTQTQPVLYQKPMRLTIR
jgi:hypothetical protein